MIGPNKYIRHHKKRVDPKPQWKRWLIYTFYDRGNTIFKFLYNIKTIQKITLCCTGFQTNVLFYVCLNS